MTWSEDRVERLKKLWSAGLTGNQIAVELGGTNRNSVIGKVHRLGLEKRDSPIPQSKPKRDRSKPSRIVSLTRPEAFGSGKPPVPDPETIPETLSKGTLSILDLTSTTCRWIIGDPRKPLEPIYCGGKASARPWGPYKRQECPYCNAHADKAAA